ncbi:MAG: primosomal protein N', partial [Candidatus Methylomirabilales bacterium]
MVDRPVWGLDRPLDYLVPEPLQEVLLLGAIVRVPLRGRRARGWVVGTRTVMDAPEGALPVAKVSSPLPVFDSALLEVARAMARRYIHPLSSFLRLFTPPLLARSKSAGLPTPAHGRD